MMPLLAFLALSQDPFLEDLEREPGTVRVELLATARVTFLSGNLGEGGVDYADNFHPGPGLALEADLLIGMPYGWWLGPYASAGIDRFRGDDFSDVFGTRVDPDDLEIRSLFVGVKSLSLLGPFWLVSGRVGLGAVRYEEVEADVTEAGVLRTDQEFFEPTTRMGFEAVGAFQYGTPRVRWHIGAGLRFQGGPEEGDDVEELLDTESVGIFTLETGVVIRF